MLLNISVMKKYSLLVIGLIACLGTRNTQAGGQPMSIVVAIRYFQVEGTSHAHLFLFDREAKEVRQLTRDGSGQDHDPVFAPDGRTIVYQRRMKSGEQWRSISSAGENDQPLAEAPSWYAHSNAAPHFGYPATVPIPGGGDRLYTASKPGDIVFKSSDGSTAIVLKDARAAPPPEDPSWYPKKPFLRIAGQPDDSAIHTMTSWGPRRAKSEKDFWAAPLQRGVVPHEKLSNDQTDFADLQVLLLGDSPFMEAAPWRVAMFHQHRGSTLGEGLFALDVNTRRVFELAPNGGSIHPLPGIPAFACVCSQRYLPLDDERTVNCSYLDLWDANLRRIRFAEPKPAKFHGASIFIDGETPKVIVIGDPE